MTQKTGTKMGLLLVATLSALTLAPAGAVVKVASFVDWRADSRNQYYVGPVKNQGSCEASSIFAAVGRLEAVYFNQTGKSLSFSEQSVLDCSVNVTGCSGNTFIATYAFAKDHGIALAEDYPWTGIYDPSKCRKTGKEVKINFENYEKSLTGDGQQVVSLVAMKVIEATCCPKGFIRTINITVINMPSERALMVMVDNIGPVPVDIDASLDSFKNYKGGIYDDPKCSSSSEIEGLHSVLIVGYGTEDDGSDYWIVKNSFGEQWGEHGYIFMSRNKHNQCGIANIALAVT